MPNPFPAPRFMSKAMKTVSSNPPSPHQNWEETKERGREEAAHHGTYVANYILHSITLANGRILPREGASWENVKDEPEEEVSEDTERRAAGKQKAA